MTKTYFVLTTILAVAVLTSGSTRLHAQMQDITVNNGQGGSASDYSAVTMSNNGAPDPETNPDPRPGIFSVGYVNISSLPDKTWDLEAFGYNATTSTLTYIGGYNPLQENHFGGEAFPLGDIFLSSGPVTPPSLSITEGTSSDYSNPGYSYAIHFTIPASGNVLTYTIYDLTASTQIETPQYNETLDAGPYALDLANLGGATIAASGTLVVQTVTGSAINALLGETLFNDTNPGADDEASDDNYVASIDLSSLGLLAFDATLTESCGNDTVAGAFSVVPEPMSVDYALAGGLFLVGSSWLRRKLQA